MFLRYSIGFCLLLVVLKHGLFMFSDQWSIFRSNTLEDHGRWWRETPHQASPNWVFCKDINRFTLFWPLRPVIMPKNKPNFYWFYICLALWAPFYGDAYMSCPSESISFAQRMCTNRQLATWQKWSAWIKFEGTQESTWTNKHWLFIESQTIYWAPGDCWSLIIGIRDTCQPTSTMRFDRYISMGSHVGFIWKTDYGELNSPTNRNCSVHSRYICHVLSLWKCPAATTSLM